MKPMLDKVKAEKEQELWQEDMPRISEVVREESQEETEDENTAFEVTPEPRLDDDFVPYFKMSFRKFLEARPYLYADNNPYLVDDSVKMIEDMSHLDSLRFD